MNNTTIDNNYMDLPLDTFTRIKQEPIGNHNTITTNNPMLDTVSNQQLDLHGDAIEYIPNELDDGNIQGLLFVLFCLKFKCKTYKICFGFWFFLQW